MIHINDHLLYILSTGVKCVVFIGLCFTFNYFRARSLYPITCVALVWVFGFAVITSLGRVLSLLLNVVWFMPYIEICGATVMIVSLSAILKDVRRKRTISGG